MKNKSLKFKIGLIIMLLSLPFFALMVIIPLLEIDNSEKIKFTTISFIIAEVLFYSGGFLLGKEIFNKYKSLFNPKNWFKKKSKTQNG